MSAVQPLISVVAPAYNEAANVAAFHAALRRCLANEAYDAEIIFVDDGSEDATAECVRELRRRDPLVRLVRLTRNFGNQAAFMAGIHCARGEAIITMDCDLQHPPEELPRMLSAWRSGARAVQMVRRKPPGGALRALTSGAFNRVLRLLTDIPFLPGAGDFRLIDRSVAPLIRGFTDARPFYRGMLGWLGIPVLYLEYDARERTAGRSSIRVRKRLQLSIDAFTALSIRPLRAAFLLGLVAIALSLAYAVVVLASYLAGRSVPGYPTIIFSIVFLGAVQLITVGVLGEYIGRIYEHSRHLPAYVALEEDLPPKEPQRSE